MSLLNNMLRGLDERSVREADTGDTVLDGIHAPRAPARERPRWPWLLGASLVALAAGAAGYGAIHWGLTGSPAATEVRNADLPPPGDETPDAGFEPTPVATAPGIETGPQWDRDRHETVHAALMATRQDAGGGTAAERGGAAVTAVRVGREGQRTRLVLELSEAVPEPEIRSDAEDVLELVMAIAPGRVPDTPSLDGTAVKALEYDRDGDRLLLRANLDGPAAHDVHTLVPGDGHGHRLVIDLEPRRVAESTAAPAGGEPDTERGEAESDAAPPRTQRGTMDITRSGGERSADDRYREATGLLRQGRSRDGERMLRDTLEADPDHHAARRALAALLLRGGRTREAEWILADGRERAPDHRGLAVLHARVLVDADRTRDAATALEDLVERGADPRDQAFLAALYQRLDRHADAADLYRRALREAPSNGPWWMGLGVSLERQGRRGEALEAYRNARGRGNLNADLRRYVDRRIRTLE